MAKEIEYKFLIDKKLWSKVLYQKRFKIIQAYLHKDSEKVIRVRMQDKKGFLTIKGKSQGIVRDEFEYQIPYKDAKELIRKFADKIIEKTRYIVNFKGKKWEVDVFDGLNKGLIMAEIELKSADESFVKPEWILEDVTLDSRYHNSNLVSHPYTKWEKI